jgi:hypothetical protein
MNAVAITKPVNALGDIFTLSLESLATAGRYSSAWRELREQTRLATGLSVALRRMGVGACPHS